MPDTEAMIGYGTVFEMANEATPTVFFPLGEVINIDPGEDDERLLRAGPERDRLPSHERGVVDDEHVGVVEVVLERSPGAL